MKLKTTINGVTYEVSVTEDFKFTALVGEWAVSGDSLMRLRTEIERTLDEIEKAGRDFAFQPRQVYNIRGEKNLIRGIHQRDRVLLVTYENGNKKTVDRGETFYALNDAVKKMLEDRKALREELRLADNLLAPHKVDVPYFSSNKGMLTHLVNLDIAITKAEEGIGTQ